MLGPILCGGYLLHFALRLALTIRATRGALQPKHTETFDATIVQPILSGDPGLADTLECNLLELPDTPFLWLIDEDDLEAQSTAKHLARQYSGQVRTVLCPTAPEGINPKLFKLERAVREVETAVFVVLDDDTRFPSGTLQALLAALADADLSTALPYYRVRGNFPTRLLAQFVNSSAALTYLPMLAFGPPISVNGMAYAVRRDTLERVGGFAPVLHHLTDDLAVARHFRDNGSTLRQVSAPVQVETHVADFDAYFRQMHRWSLFALLLLRSEPAATRLRIGLLLGVPPLLLWGAVLTCLTGGMTAMIGLGATLALRAAALSWVQGRLTGRVRHQPVLSVLSELLQPLHLAHAAISPRIRWRSRRYRVYANDRFTSE